MMGRVWTHEQRIAHAAEMRARWANPAYREKVLLSLRRLPIDVPAGDQKAYNAAYYQLRKEEDPRYVQRGANLRRLRRKK